VCSSDLAEEQVFPLAKDLREYFDSKNYREIVKQSLKRYQFTIEAEDFERKVGSID
jgi:hypothetical protein